MIPEYEKIYVSVREENAKYLIRKAKQLIDNLKYDLKIPLSRRAEGLIEFEETGSIIQAFPCSGAAARGFNADVTLDELAFMPNETEVMDAILQGTVRAGRTLEFISTPFGQTGEFADMWEEAGWDMEAVWRSPTQKNEFKSSLSKFRQGVDDDTSYYIIPWFSCPDLTYERAWRRSRKKESVFLQEYCLNFADNAKSILPIKVIKSAVDKSLKYYDVGSFPIGTYERYMGVDPAEGYNETAIAITERIENMWRLVYTWHKKAPQKNMFH